MSNTTHLKRKKRSKSKAPLLTGNNILGFLKNFTKKTISPQSTIPTMPSLTNISRRTRVKTGGRRTGTRRTGRRRTGTRSRRTRRNRKQNGG